MERTTLARSLAAARTPSVHLHADDFWGLIVNGYVDPGVHDGGPLELQLGLLPVVTEVHGAAFDRLWIDRILEGPLATGTATTSRHRVPIQYGFASLLGPSGDAIPERGGAVKLLM